LKIGLSILLMEPRLLVLPG